MDLSGPMYLEEFLSKASRGDKFSFVIEEPCHEVNSVAMFQHRTCYVVQVYSADNQWGPCFDWTLDKGNKYGEYGFYLSTKRHADSVLFQFVDLPPTVEEKSEPKPFAGKMMDKHYKYEYHDHWDTPITPGTSWSKYYGMYEGSFNVDENISPIALDPYKHSTSIQPKLPSAYSGISLTVEKFFDDSLRESFLKVAWNQFGGNIQCVRYVTEDEWKHYMKYGNLAGE